MKNLKLLTLFVTLVLLFNSCKKDELSRTQMLCGKFWINTSCTIDPPIIVAGTPITDFWAQMDQCWRDDLQKFESNGIYTFDEGASKCDVNDPQTTTGLWSWNSDETIVSVTQGGNTTSYTILELSSTSFKAKYSQLANWGSGNLMYTYTFTAKVK